MSGIGATQAQGIEIRAVIFPACAVCKQSFTMHLPDGCTGYQPSGEVRDMGVRAKSYSSGMPVLRRLACEAMWAVERRIQGWRESIERR